MTGTISPPVLREIEPMLLGEEWATGTPNHRCAREELFGPVLTVFEFDSAVPFGGIKQSGFGCDLGDAATPGCTVLKSVTAAW